MWRLLSLFVPHHCFRLLEWCLYIYYLNCMHIIDLPILKTTTETFVKLDHNRLSVLSKILRAQLFKPNDVVS